MNRYVVRALGVGDYHKWCVWDQLTRMQVFSCERERTARRNAKRLNRQAKNHWTPDQQATWNEFAKAIRTLP